MVGFMLSAEEKKAKRAAAHKLKVERQAAAGLTRTVKLRLYPTSEQAQRINRTISTIRFVWNKIWLPMVQDAQRVRGEHAERNGSTKEAWKEAWRLHPDPTETAYNQARINAAKDGSDCAWIGEAIQTPLTRAARNFALAVQSSHGRTQSGAARKVRSGRVQPRSRRDDAREGLEWQLQGTAPLGGVEPASVIAHEARVVTVPVIGKTLFRDKGTLLREYLDAGAEACELTVKREGKDYYACIAVRGLQPLAEHANVGAAVGLDMGVVNPLSTSDGRHVTSHQGHGIAAHLARLEQRKLRVKRQYARKLHAAAERSGAVTATGAFKKGVRIENSNRMRRLNDRLNKIERQIIGFRADWQRKQALQIVRQSEIVVVEALSIKNMTRSAAGTIEVPGRNVRAKSALNRAILARGWGSMRQRLKSKAEELCGRVLEVDPSYTSQTCPRCEHTARDNRKTQAQFMCVACGYTEHADIVGATNILARGLSAGALPAAGRGGLATGSVPSGAVAERAVEPSNKSSCEPEASSKNAEGSRGAKPYNANSELGVPYDNPHKHKQALSDEKRRGSRSDDE